MAITRCRSSRTWQGIWSRPGRTSSGWPTSPMSRSPSASSMSPSYSMPGRARSSATPSAARPLDRRSANDGRPAHSHRKARTSTRLHPPHGPRHYAAGRYRQGLAEHGGQVDESNWIDIGSSFVPGELVAAYLFAQLEVIDMIMPGACRSSTGTRTRSQAQPMPAA